MERLSSEYNRSLKSESNLAPKHLLGEQTDALLLFHSYFTLVVGLLKLLVITWYLHYGTAINY